MHIGPYALPNALFVAPMAGVTDRPFRQLCRRLGAGYAVSEMVTSRKDLWASLKTSRRANHDGEAGPIAVQIAGTDAAMMAEAAAYNIDRGAQIIDINMGCPALKMRTGWCAAEKNALRIALAAEGAGVAMVTVHGRTREQGYTGLAEYDTVRAVKAALTIPVVANGDIDSPQKAEAVLAFTGADAVMIGRAAQGRPWIFQETAHYLATGQTLPAPAVLQARDWLIEHLHDHYSLYGELTGMRTARKHIGWAVRALPGGEDFRQVMNRLDSSHDQIRALNDWFGALAQQHERLPCP